MLETVIGTTRSAHLPLLILFSNLNCDTGRGGLTEWRREYSSVRHRRPHRNHHLCGALLQDGWIQHLQGSRLSSEGIWNDAGCLTGFNFPKIRENDRPVPQAYLIIHNFCVTIVACALDLTFKFNWVLDAGSGKVWFETKTRFWERNCTVTLSEHQFWCDHVHNRFFSMFDVTITDFPRCLMSP